MDAPKSLPPDADGGSDRAGGGLVLDGERIGESVRRNGSIAENTRRAYAGVLRRAKAWLDGRGRELDDASLAAFIESLRARNLTWSSGEMARKAVRFHARAQSRPCPDGPLTRAAIRRFRRETAGRGRGRPDPLLAEDTIAILETAGRRREYADGRRESAERAARRSRVDAALVAVLFLGGLRRSEAAALTWGDVEDASDGHALLIHVRSSKTNPDGRHPDSRYINGEFALAVRRLREETGGAGNSGAKVFGGLTGASLSRRLTRAAAAAGIKKRITAHSGRYGLAVELTRRGAPTHAIMLVGGWRTSAMVSHYSSAARAEKGAVAKYMG